MLGRMVVKLLFKATVPLIAVAGVMTYGVYLRGGDPASLWRPIVSSFSDKVAGASGKITGAVSQSADQAVGFAGQLSGGAGAGGSPSSTQVYTWKDENGVKHFGSLAPVGANAQVMSINPNTNLIAPPYVAPVIPDASDDEVEPGGRAQLVKQYSAQTPRRQQQRGSERRADSGQGEPLPGIAGQILSGGGADSPGAGLNADQLIRMLQATQD